MLLNLRIPYAFIKRDFLTEKSYKFNFLFQLINIFISSLTYYFLSKLFGTNLNSHLQKYGGDYFSFVIIGIAFSNYLHVAMTGFSNAIREAQLLGIMEALLVTKTNIPTVILSSSLYRFIYSSVRIIFFLIIGSLLFSLNLQNANYIAGLLILLLTIFSFSCFGIISASFIMIFKKGDPIAWLFTSISWLIGGVIYPVSVLPAWLQKFSYILPITYTLEGMRLALLQGYSFMQLLPNILALFGFIVIMLPVSLYIFKLAIMKAKRDGTLTQY